MKLKKKPKFAKLSLEQIIDSQVFAHGCAELTLPGPAARELLRLARIGKEVEPLTYLTRTECNFLLGFVEGNRDCDNDHWEERDKYKGLKHMRGLSRAQVKKVWELIIKKIKRGAKC